MITEDYVSFETAKLLKEKGFNAECNSYFIADNEIALIPNRRDFNYHGVYLSAPTHQLVMKWLREKHNLSVEVYRTACGYIGCVVAIPSGTDIKFLKGDGDDYSGQYTKWEYACEAAIKYCLENLI